MDKGASAQVMNLKRFADLIQKQTGRVVRPYRADGYVNLVNKYGTNRDTSEKYMFEKEPTVPDDMLAMYYEGNGLFAKIIDAPAEEAVRKGFTIEGLQDENLEKFYTECLDELDWEETIITAVKWARLFGGSIAVMLINDGRGLDEPLDWRNIRSIDDIRVYDRSVIRPDYNSMFNYSADDPFATRGSRLGYPEYYDVYSRYGSFRVHDSRCLVFQNGVLPENCTNSEYQIWGMPEYIRLKRAMRDAEIAHGSAPKLLDRSVQAVYKMKDLCAELATEEGEDRVLRRLQTIDMARGLLSSITIDSEGEDYDFRQFNFSGVSEVIDTTCNFLSALTSIPQTVLFGRAPAGMNATGLSDLENWYNYVERLQKRMIKKNLRYLLSIIFQAGIMTGEIDEVPDIKVKFNPLWSLSEQEQAQLEQTKAATQQTKAATAQIYVGMQAIDPQEVRKKLADSDEFDVETMLDEYDEEELEANMPQQGGEEGGMPGAPGGGMPGMPGGGAPGGAIPQMGAPEAGQPQAEPVQAGLSKEPEAKPQEPAASEAGGQVKEAPKEAEKVSVEPHDKDTGGNAPAAAPAASKLPEDMSKAEKAKAEEGKEEKPAKQEEPEKQEQPAKETVKKPAKEAERKGDEPEKKDSETEVVNSESNDKLIDIKLRLIKRSLENRIKSREGLKPAVNGDSAPDYHLDVNNGAVGVYVIKDGKILCGVRKDGDGVGQICGPGGHIEPGETPGQAAIRETQEEFGITPTELIPFGRGEKGMSGISPYLFLCVQYEGTPKCDEDEMTAPAFRAMEDYDGGKDLLFPAFRDGLERLKKAVYNEIIGNKDLEKKYLTSESNYGIIKMDGEEVNADWRIPPEKLAFFTAENGKKVALNEETGETSGLGPDIDSKTRGNKGSGKEAGERHKGTKPSAKGKNVPCTGFRDAGAVERHEKHWPEFGFKSNADYEKAAIEFIQQPVGGDIDGYYRPADGAVIRFNRKTGEIGIGKPGKEVLTYFKAKYDKETGEVNLRKANNYFNILKEEEAEKDE